jgi:hypothetical protein
VQIYVSQSSPRPYGSKTYTGAEQIAVSEGWGYYVGNTFSADYYRSDLPITSDFHRDLLENQIPGDNDWSRWIVFGLYHDLTDTGEPTLTGVLDNVNTYSSQQIFRGLQPSVTTVQGFRQELLNRNNNQQATEVNQLVTSYRY